jgi:ABC-type phosphate/phosphonate transport system permease subunit
MEKKTPVALVCSAVLITACALTKYYGMTLIPLLLAYSLVKRRGWVWRTTYLVIPVVILAWYQWATQEIYGRGLLLDAASYATNIQSHFGRWSIPKVLVGLAFAGGCMIVVLVFTSQLWSRLTIIAGVLLAAIVTVIISSVEMIG